MKTDILNKMIERAKTRKNGVYSANGYKYGVVGGRMIYFIENKAIYQRVGNFVTPLSAPFDYEFNAIKALKKFMETGKI